MKKLNFLIHFQIQICIEVFNKENLIIDELNSEKLQIFIFYSLKLSSNKYWKLKLLFLIELRPKIIRQKCALTGIEKLGSL